MKTVDLILCGIFSAILSVFSMITIPIGAVPITLGLFALFLLSLLLSPRLAVLSVLVYLLLGAVGLPVFSGMQGRIGVLLSPTGGYLLAYPPMAWLISRARKKIPASILSLLVCYALETLQFALITQRSLKESIFICVVPFLVFDALKLVCALLLSKSLKKRIPQNNK